MLIRYELTPPSNVSDPWVVIVILCVAACPLRSLIVSTRPDRSAAKGIVIVFAEDVSTPTKPAVFDIDKDIPTFYF